MWTFYVQEYAIYTKRQNMILRESLDLSDLNNIADACFAFLNLRRRKKRLKDVFAL